ncbi:hypothetical protein BH20ACI3_BH20ACI3_11910 [soil metagenome]
MTAHHGFKARDAGGGVYKKRHPLMKRCGRKIADLLPDA